MPTRTAPGAYRPRITSFYAGFLERVPAETHIAAREDDQLGTLQEGAVVWAERRIDHATVGDSNRIHRRLKDPVELRTIPIGGTDVGRAEWCVASQSIEGRFEEQSVLPLPEQQLTVRQKIERLELWRSVNHGTQSDASPLASEPPEFARLSRVRKSRAILLFDGCRVGRVRLYILTFVSS